MKKNVITVVLLCLTAANFTMPVSAEQSNYNDISEIMIPPEVSDSDPCKIVFCMFGRMKGENPRECRGAVNYYFSIMKKKKGKFKPAETARKRLKLMNSCPEADNEITNKINKMFGRSRG